MRGISALNVAADDPRVAAVFVLSGSSVLPGSSPEDAAAVMSRIHVPVAYVVGGPEDIASTFARQDYDLLPDGVPAFFAQRSAGDHATVSMDASIQVEDAQIATAWTEFALYGYPQLRDVLLTNPCGDCPAGTWSIDSKHLDLIESP